MPQIFNVVRCFSCSTFQVHQVKKAKKWACKVCGEKQSLLKIFGQGSGAECRQHVQRLNYLRQDMDEKEYQMAMDEEFLDVPQETDYSSSSSSSFTNGANEFRKLPTSSHNNHSSSSKWSKFLPCEEETNEMDEIDYEGEEGKVNQRTNSQTFLYQEKRKNPFSDVYSRESPKITSYFMKKPRTSVNDNFQLSSSNSEESPNWSHSVSIESRNRGTNLITRHQPVHFENLDEITSDEPCKTLRNGMDSVKSRKDLSNPFKFYSSFSMAKSPSCLSGVWGERDNFPERDSSTNPSDVESRPSEEVNVFPKRKDVLKSGTSKSLNYKNGLRDPQNGSTNNASSAGSLSQLNQNSGIGLLSSGVDERKMDADAEILPLPCKLLSYKQSNVMEPNFSVSKSKLEINSVGSNDLKNIFQLDESEVDLDF